MQKETKSWIKSRKGKIKARLETKGHNRSTRGFAYVPWFDENIFINKICLDATGRQSKQTNFKKCAVKIYKV